MRTKTAKHVESVLEQGWYQTGRNDMLKTVLAEGKRAEALTETLGEFLEVLYQLALQEADKTEMRLQDLTGTHA